MSHSGLYLLAVEVTSHCNLACPHCYGAFDRRGSPMPPDWPERIAAQAEHMGVRVVTITGGEPLTLGERLPEYVRPFASRGFRTFLTTNGVGIGSAVLRQHLEGFAAVQVSLDGLRPVHDRIRGRGRFDEAVASLQRLREWGIETAVMMTLHRDNVRDVERMLDLCAELGARLSLERYSGPGRSDTVQPAQHDELLRAFEVAHGHCLGSFDPCYTAFGAWYRGATLAAGRPIQGGCSAGIAALGVTADLQVLSCVRIRTPVGDLRRSTLEEIWSGGPILDRLRRRDLLEEPCGSCSLSPVCGGCRAEALHATGRLMAADPGCPVPFIARAPR